ncbi:MAG: hypothetical protein JSU94_08015 [Phycisphaerales bacterium]|nr:MAG: hypothetical protein JSU94_08015 [Phycisphaerales bacterium]
MASIVELPETAGKLGPKEREVFEGIFDVTMSEGRLVIPETFEEQTWRYFSDKDENGQPVEDRDVVLARLTRQKVVRTFNRWTAEGALFNELRARRPGVRFQSEAEKEYVAKHIEQARKGCDFCEPEKQTTDDVFGRIRGRHCTTGANIAKFDALHGLVFFDEHNPLDFGAEEAADYIETGFAWLRKAHEQNSEFAYPFFLWNCLDKSGASRVHGHAQVLLGRDMHYARVEILRRAADAYRRSTGRDYFDDLLAAHDSVGLALAGGEVRVFVNITPVKEKETVIISRRPPDQSDDAKAAIWQVLECMIHKLGVTCFNLAISMPAIGADDLPYFVRVVDRGSLLKTTSDLAGMELYGSTVIASDPYRVVEALREG